MSPFVNKPPVQRYDDGADGCHVSRQVPGGTVPLDKEEAAALLAGMRSLALQLAETVVDTVQSRWSGDGRMAADSGPAGGGRPWLKASCTRRSRLAAS